MCQTLWIRCAGISGFLAVGLGAFGAHALKATLEEHQSTHLWQTAVLYHLVHSVVLALPAAQRPGRIQPAWFFLIGMVLFSGSLYTMALLRVSGLGMVTPLGGLCFLAGWALLAFSSSPSSAGGTVPPD